MGGKTTWEQEKVHSKLQIRWVNNEELLITEKKICIMMFKCFKSLRYVTRVRNTYWYINERDRMSLFSAANGILFWKNFYFCWGCTLLPLEQ